MGIRHFDGEGCPDLDFITKDIVNFVKSLRFEIVKAPYTVKLLNLLNDESERLLPWEMDLDPSMTGIDFKSNEHFNVVHIYAVGSQVQFLQRREYNVGRDLDLVVMLNVPELSSFPRDRLYYPVGFILPKYLNADLGKRVYKSDAEYGLSVDTFVKGNNAIIESVDKGPHLKIYPQPQP